MNSLSETSLQSKSMDIVAKELSSCADKVRTGKVIQRNFDSPIMNTFQDEDFKKNMDVIKMFPTFILRPIGSANAIASS